MIPFPNLKVAGAVVIVGPSAWSTTDRDPSITVSPDNRTATGGGQFGRGIRGAQSKSAGKFYTEIIVGKIDDLTGIGVANSTASLTAIIGSDTNGIIYLGGGGIRYNGSNIATQAVQNANDTIQIAEDYTLQKIWFGKNGTFVGNPAAGTGGYTMPAGALFLGATIGGSDFYTLTSGVYAPPSGFIVRG